MKESERLQQQAAALEVAERAYADLMNGISVAAGLLTAAEPTMATLVKQHAGTTGTGAIFNPGLFQRVAGNRNVEMQVELAQAVCAFVAVWRKLRDECLADAAERGGAA